MALSVHAPLLYARPVPADRAGNRVVHTTAATSRLPRGCVLLHGNEQEEDHLRSGAFLQPPFELIPILPAYASYPGEIIGVVAGPDWETVESALREVRQEQDTSVSTEDRIAWSDDAAGASTTRVPAAGAPSAEASTTGEPAAGAPSAGKPAAEAPTSTEGAAPPEGHLVEGIYSTDVQLHRMDAPLWAEVRPENGGLTVRAPTQWPGHVRRSVAETTGVDPRRVEIRVIPVEGGRDGALYLPSLLAAVAALCAMHLQTGVRLALRNDQMGMSGGRSPSKVRFLTRLRPDGTVLTNTIDARLDCGAYPTLEEETKSRLRGAAEALYQVEQTHYSARAFRSPVNPMGAFEGVGTAQLTFAREVHFNRLAGIMEEDPVSWRRRVFRSDWPVTLSLAETLAETSGFHRRYAANELVRKRRLQLPRNSTALKGIGCAFAEQISAMTSTAERGYIAVQLEQDGSARLYCSTPTPTPRLRLAWRSIVARELQIDRDLVTLDTACRSEQYDAGPRLFSRGASIIPRAIQSACEAIQKQRFREPLPILVRRALRSTRARRDPADALRSLGGAAVEATVIPATMEIDVRSVTMVVYCGQILDKNAAETELRRGIYQALSWTLHETVDRASREAPRETDLLADPDIQRHYNPGFPGAPPKIKVVLLPGAKRSGPVGIGEIPFLTVPAALVSAISQASGLYLDSIPVKPREVLRMLLEEE